MTLRLYWNGRDAYDTGEPLVDLVRALAHEPVGRLVKRSSATEAGGDE